MTQEILVVSETEQLIVQETSGQSVTEQVVSQEVLSEGVQGPPGPTGPGGSITNTATAAEAVGGHRAVVNTPSGIAYADADNLAHCGRVVGITTAAAGAGSPITFQASGKITEPSWFWSPNADIWLGLNGLPTQTIPGAAVFAQRLGFALSPTEMWVELGEPVVF